MKKDQNSDCSSDEVDDFDSMEKMPNIPIPKKMNQNNLNKQKFKPLDWKEYFDKQIMYKNLAIYMIDREDKNEKVRSDQSCRPIFLFLHGAGMNATSFGVCGSYLRKWSNVVCFDWRGHGDSVNVDDKELDVDSLISEAIDILEWTIKEFMQSNVIIVGHSMGGSIAVKMVEKVQQITHLEQRVQGLVVIDVVEGTAMEALPFMEQIVKQRPQKFDSIDDCIEWTLRTKTIKNVQSARLSVPQQLVKSSLSSNKVVYNWKVDLLGSKKHWTKWFEGLTKSFLAVRIPKLLLLAEKERMDKELTIAQMQGKFKLTVLHNVGHTIHEDDPLGVAKQLHNMIKMFKIPVSTDDYNMFQQVGVGKFNPSLQNFKE